MFTGTDIPHAHAHVELALRDEPQQVRKLHCDHAIRRQQLFHPGDEVVEIGDVRQNVVADEKIRASDPVPEVPGGIEAEVQDLRRDAAVLGDRRHVGSRLDSQHVEATCRKMLEQVSIVRCNFHNPAVFAKVETLNRRVGIGARMGDPAV